MVYIAVTAGRAAFVPNDRSSDIPAAYPPSACSTGPYRQVCRRL